MQEESISRRLDNLENRIIALEKDSAVVGVEFLSVKSDLKEIKDSINWVTRLILGALILAVVGFVLGGGLTI